MQPRRLVALVCVIVLTTILSACGSDSSGSTSTSPSSVSTSSSATVFDGTFAGTGGQSGGFSVTIQPAAAGSSAASLRSAGSTINVTGNASLTLAGTYDSLTSNVSLSGGGFTLTGTISGSVLSGSFTGPSSSSGVFSSLNAAQGSVTAYCGTYIGSPDAGVFSVQVSAGGALSGESLSTNGHGSPTTFIGQVNGTSITFTTSEGGSGTGTIQNGSVSGTVSPGPEGAGGTFTGSACSTAPLPVVTSVRITGTVPLGASAQVTATATLSNGTTQNVTSQSIWLSSDTTIATVSPNNGYVTDVGLGVVVLSAAYAGVTGLDTVTFTPPAGPPQLDILPGPNVTVSVGQSLQLTATAGWTGVLFNVTHLVTWSTQPGVTVSSGGLLTILPSFVVCNQMQNVPAPCPTAVTVTYLGASNGTTFFVIP